MTTPIISDIPAPGDLAVNVLPNGGRVPCRLVRPYLYSDGALAGWVVRSPEAKRSGYAVEFSNLEFSS